MESENIVAIRRADGVPLWSRWCARLVLQFTLLPALQALQPWQNLRRRQHAPIHVVWTSVVTPTDSRTLCRGVIRPAAIRRTRLAGRGPFHPPCNTSTVQQLGRRHDRQCHHRQHHPRTTPDQRYRVDVVVRAAEPGRPRPACRRGFRGARFHVAQPVPPGRRGHCQAVRQGRDRSRPGGGGAQRQAPT